MGAFNAYEIKQLKAKFGELSDGHNMLVRVTQIHEADIKSIHMNMKAIMKVLDIMAEYNPGELRTQIDEQLDIFQDRITAITNAIQQLHHTDQRWSSG